MASLLGCSEGLLDGLRDVYENHLGSRDHNLLDLRVMELEDTVKDLPFFGIESAELLGLGDRGSDLFTGDRSPVDNTPDAEHREENVRDQTQDFTKRVDELRKKP